MNKIKPKYLNREKNLIEALESFENLSQEHQILNLGYYCIEFGCYTSELDAVDFGKDFQKIPEPDLEEIQDIESASFLSFREILSQWFATKYSVVLSTIFQRSCTFVHCVYFVVYVSINPNITW